MTWFRGQLSEVNGVTSGFTTSTDAGSNNP